MTWRVSKKPSVANLHYSSVIKAMKRSPTHWSMVLVNSSRSVLRPPQTVLVVSFRTLSPGLFSPYPLLCVFLRVVVTSQDSFFPCLPLAESCLLGKVETYPSLQIPLISRIFSLCLGPTVSQRQYEWLPGWVGGRHRSVKVNTGSTSQSRSGNPAGNPSGP